MVKPDIIRSSPRRVPLPMPRVICGQCSRELEYSGSDRPSFCAYCGQSLGTSTLATTPDSLSERDLPMIRGEETVDYVPSAVSRSTREVPQRVKGYRLIRQLGRGGMGTVYEAEDSRHGRRVALKIIAPGYVDSIGSVERFRQEGRLASSLAHPRCVFVLEADEDDDGRPFIAMELMTGDTLQDLVEKGGPLAVGDAVSKILDVAEGLREAHRLGLIHRDVKPSNCFLDGDGRVKVGDFGLSKSQAGSAHLTRTGAFLGTPLYASPEQIKVDELDGRTDVYSAAATLFFLLTGRAPFDRGDASATMARIVTDPAPSARQGRPEVPAGLDRAIRKGLERDRDRRFRDLDEFRDALQPFVPGHVPAAKVGLRIAAYLFDYFLLVVLLLVSFPFHLSEVGHFAISFLTTLIYYAIGDGIWGGSPGKWLLRLRVARTTGLAAAGVGRSILRALVLLPLADIPVDLLWYFSSPSEDESVMFDLGCLLAEVVGLTLLSAPMWLKGDLRGLHDLIAGTRVIGLPRDNRRRAAGPRRALGRDRGSVSRPVGVLQSVGPYKVRGAVRWEPDRRVVSGEDSTLGREAWIVIRPKGSLAPDPVRREITRATRPRWLNGGEQNEGRWDAYIAPAGCPIADLAGPEGLSWHDARPILEDLADELASACMEQTLPPGLTVDEVWVEPDGRAILVDSLGSNRATAEPPGLSDDERALGLLRKVAALALEGGRWRSDLAPTSIKSPVPIHASEILGRLLGGPSAYPTVAAFRADLELTRHHPTEVTIGQRATHLGVMALFLSTGLLFSYGAVYFILDGRLDQALSEWAEFRGLPINLVKIRAALVVTSVFPLAWMAWNIVARGGFALKLAGLGLVQSDGRLAPRWRCLWRAFLIWAPIATLLFASVWVRGQNPGTGWPGWLVFGLAVALLPLYVLSALFNPSRGPHDRLSGLRVVPR
jgi:eukaryotic-like serine/threonine-protein kinase